VITFQHCVYVREDILFHNLHVVAGLGFPDVEDLPDNVLVFSCLVERDHLNSL